MTTLSLEINLSKKPCNSLVERVLRKSLHPAIARDPRDPIRLNFLRERPKPFLKHGHALLRFLRSGTPRDARKPHANVEVVHTGTCPADERTLADGHGESLVEEDLDVIPEGSGLGEEGPLNVFGSLAVENCVETREFGDPPFVERLVCLTLGCRCIPFQMAEPCKRLNRQRGLGASSTLTSYGEDVCETA